MDVCLRCGTLTHASVKTSIKVAKPKEVKSHTQKRTRDRNIYKHRGRGTDCIYVHIYVRVYNWCARKIQVLNRKRCEHIHM